MSSLNVGSLFSGIGGLDLGLAGARVMAARQPDHLSAEARRWVNSHRGPRTPAVSRVMSSLMAYYDDMVVVQGIVRFWEKRA